jgi:hypothetical protein
MNKSVYVESSVISYLTARRSRDLVVSAYQQITREWWHSELTKYQCFISDFVIDEVSRGDSEAASERLKAIKTFKKIGLNETVLDYVRERLYEINGKLNLRTPTICTPEELIGGIYE